MKMLLKTIFEIYSEDESFPYEGNEDKLGKTVK